MERFLPEENYLSIGELAEIYSISPRTLRLYHDMGIFAPYYVDTQSGYRYYSQKQLPRLEVIIQMKALGLSLKRIADILNSGDISIFEALISEQIDELDQKIEEYTTARNALYRQLRSCSFLRNLPELEKPFIEFIPKRHALTFDIKKYDLQGIYKNGSPWGDALLDIKDVLLKNNISLSYLNQVGCIISEEDLKKRNFFCNGAFILIDEKENRISPNLIPAGTYACMYQKYIAMDGRKESEGLEQLLNYIAENDYRLAGPYRGEVIAKTSLFDANDQTILVRSQIPVKTK